MSIYRSQLSKSLVINLYNAQIAKLDIPYQDIFVETSFGRTHVVEIGNPEGKPLLVFHGGNSTTAYNLLEAGFCWKSSMSTRWISSDIRERARRIS